MNLRYYENGDVGFSIDETTDVTATNVLLSIFAIAAGKDYQKVEDVPEKSNIDKALKRTTPFLTHEVFSNYHTETEMMRYIKRLDRKDISLAQSMISLGSCTMKLNAAAEMLPLSRPEFMSMHPLVPEDQAEGYRELISNLSEDLKVITGFAGVSLQPNSGAAGEYAGLRVIRAYLESIGQGHRNKILIPASAHGTNPASAIQAGFETVTCACDEQGNVDMGDLRAKAEENKEALAALMITYPSTHGIFETEIKEICEIIHSCGAQVYMDGANMNAQVGLTNPGFIGADVCHLNLHKTFASPHGGGGPGVGPICVAEHLVPFLPGHSIFGSTQNQVSAAPFGSAGILPITYGYIRMMGTEGLTQATKIAILNANYLAACLKDTYGIVYRGATGFVGHEMILECRKVHEETGISENDIAKRLMDYGYHAPTLSFPVHGTLMIEPTESESLAELNNFIDVMLNIWKEIQEVKNGEGPHPIKTPRGWLHLAHGVRGCAAGLRYVLYMYMTALEDPTRPIATPAGYFMAPENEERIGDVSNVLFSNGWIADEDGTVYIYYASSDTRMHVAVSTIDKLVDYCMNTPADGLTTTASVETLKKLIDRNLPLLK